MPHNLTEYQWNALTVPKSLDKIQEWVTGQSYAVCLMKKTEFELMPWPRGTVFKIEKQNDGTKKV